MPDVFDVTIVPGRRDGVDAFEQRPLDVDLLDDRFEIQSTPASLREVGVEAAGRDQRGGVRGEERIGLQRAGALEPVARGVGGQVEQQGTGTPALAKCAAICAPIVPGAEHGNRSNRQRSELIARARR